MLQELCRSDLSRSEGSFCAFYVGQQLLSCCRTHNVGGGGDCMACGLGPGCQKCCLNVLPAPYRTPSLGGRRVRRAKAGWTIVAVGGLCAWNGALWSVLPHQHLVIAWGCNAACWVQAFNASYLFGVRTGKHSRAGLQLLLQKGQASCSSHGMSSKLLQVSQTHQGSLTGAKHLRWVVLHR